MLDEAQLWVQRLVALLPSSGGDSEPAAAIASSDLFGPLDEATFPFERLLGRDDFTDSVSTQSSVATLEPAEKAETLAAVGKLWDAEAGPHGLRLPYVTYAYRAQRL